MMLTMNPDEIKSALGQLATAICFFLVGAGVITASQSADLTGNIATLASAIGAAIPAILGIINIAGSIWRHWNQKKVPETAVVVAGPQTAMSIPPKP